MRHLSAPAFFLALLYPWVVFGGGDPDCTHYWTKLRELNDRYEQKHDGKAAVELWKLLPTGKKLPPTDCQKHEETINALSRDQDYRSDRMKKGDVVAIQLSFRLMNVADGGFAEDLEIELGKQIQTRPKVFLKYLQAEHGDSFCSDGLLGNTGDYDDDSSASRKESEKRIKALQSVKEPALKKLRDICISRLRGLSH